MSVTLAQPAESCGSGIGRKGCIQTDYDVAANTRQELKGDGCNKETGLVLTGGGFDIKGQSDEAERCARVLSSKPGARGTWLVTVANFGDNCRSLRVAVYTFCRPDISTSNGKDREPEEPMK